MSRARTNTSGGSWTAIICGRFGLLALVMLLPLAADAATFEEANQLYDHAKYAEAANAYRALSSSSAPSANLFFNLGNAEYRLGAAGRAALNYERALAADPEHPEARTNLALVRQKSGARLLPASVLEHVLLPWTERTYTMLAAISGWALVFALYGIAATGRRESFRLWGTVTVAAALGCYSGVALWASAQRRSIAIVLDREVIARVAPADRAETVEPLPAGSSVRVLSERGAWSYCELPGKGRGWLPRESLATIAPETSA